VNWVDLIVIAILGLSALLAFLRGFVREVLGIAALVGAALVARWAFPYVHDRFRGWLGSSDLGDAAALAAVFLGALILFSFFSALIGGLVRASALGGMDRTLGVVFGLARGAALVVFAYIAAGWVTAPEQWPAPVLEARSLPYVAGAAGWVAGLLPADLHLHIPTLPLAPETRAEDLLRVLPQGRATARPPATTGG
jgi:membrane protein required for colicin V production